jgi:hypothetical protein
MADNLPPSSADVMKSGSLNLPELSGPHRPVMGLLYFTLRLVSVMPVCLEGTIFVRQTGPSQHLLTPDNTMYTYNKQDSLLSAQHYVRLCNIALLFSESRWIWTIAVSTSPLNAIVWAYKCLK